MTQDPLTTNSTIEDELAVLTTAPPETAPAPAFVDDFDPVAWEEEREHDDLSD